MAIYKGGQAIHPYIGGKRVQTIYKNGQKIYQDYIKPGTKLADIDSFYQYDGHTFVLPVAVSKLKTGVRVTIKYWTRVNGADTVVGGGSWASETSFYLPKTGEWIELSMPEISAESTKYKPLIGLSNNAIQIGSVGTLIEVINSDRWYADLGSVYAY